MEPQTEIGAKRQRTNNYGYLPDFVQPTFTSNANKYDMAYWYTKNGNITQLNRTDNAGIKTVQQYAYANSTNNKLTGVTWTVGTNTPFTHNYGYDATGNLLNDSRNNVSSITYSAYSDMPKQIVSSGLAINYRYFGGARSVKILSSTDREYYIAGMVLKQTGEVKSYQTANGYAVPNSNGTSVDYFYNVKDWLGTNPKSWIYAELKNCKFELLLPHEKFQLKNRSFCIGHFNDHLQLPADR